MQQKQGKTFVAQTMRKVSRLIDKNRNVIEESVTMTGLNDIKERQKKRAARLGLRV